MSTQEMMQHKSSLGGWRNITPLGDEPDWIEAYPPESIDPNDRYLFGYIESEFLRKQYK